MRRRRRQRRTSCCCNASELVLPPPLRVRDSTNMWRPLQVPPASCAQDGAASCVAVALHRAATRRS